MLSVAGWRGWALFKVSLGLWVPTSVTPDSVPGLSLSPARHNTAQGRLRLCSMAFWGWVLHVLTVGVSGGNPLACGDSSPLTSNNLSPCLSKNGFDVKCPQNSLPFFFFLAWTYTRYTVSAFWLHFLSTFVTNSKVSAGSKFCVSVRRCRKERIVKA